MKPPRVGVLLADAPARLTAAWSKTRSTPRSPKPSAPRPEAEQAAAVWFSRSSTCINAEGRVARVVSGGL